MSVSVVTELNRHRRLLLNLFLGSIAVNAVLGIWALLTDGFDQTQGKILATSFLVSATMLSVLVNGSPIQKRVLWPVPIVSAAAGAAGFLWFIFLMWGEFDSSATVKLGISALIVAAGGTLAGLLALFPLRRWHVPLRHAHIGLTGLLVATILTAIWAEIDADWFIRFLGVQSVLVAALTLAIPALSKFLPPEPERTTIAAALRYCPSCGQSLPLREQPLTDSVVAACPRCELEFMVSPAPTAIRSALEEREAYFDGTRPNSTVG